MTKTIELKRLNDKMEEYSKIITRGLKNES